MPQFTRHINLMQGLGDTIYARPFIRAAVTRGEKIWLKTSWPQLFLDMRHAIHFVSPGNIGLRTQHKNIARSGEAGLYEPEPKRAQWMNLSYVSRPNDSISAALNRQLPLGATGSWQLTLPGFYPRTPPVDGPYILVRPATVRKEWRADNRNPLPEYLVEACKRLSPHYKLIGVADLEEGHEFGIVPMPPVDVQFYRGELDIMSLMSLVQQASAIVSPVGWAVPAALAARVPLLCILGGQGGHHSPQRLVDPALDPQDTITWVQPDNYCMCHTYTHPCDRTISDIDFQIESFLHDLQRV